MIIKITLGFALAMLAISIVLWLISSGSNKKNSSKSVGIAVLYFSCY
jgi:hypothetical protein